MLVLTRKQGQSLLIGDNVELTVLEISGDKVRIAIDAPKDISILRKELAEARAANKESAYSPLPREMDLTQLQAVLFSAKEEKNKK